MKLPEISIRRPVLASMMNCALILFGAISLTHLPVRELPDIDPPIVSVSTTYPGASAAVVETEVTEPLEEAINNIPGIKTLSSSSREQSSQITVEFQLHRDIDLAAQDVRDRVSRIRGLLPEDIREPVVSKQDSDARPVLWIGMSSAEYTPLEMTNIAERQIMNHLQTVDGVSSVTIGGEQRFAVRIWLDSEKMAAHRVTVLDLEQALREQNIELPSGRIENTERELSIQTHGQLKTPDEFNRMVIRMDEDRVVRLRDIGEAREGVENERTMARNNGNPCIFLGVIKQSKANTVEMADGIREKLERIKPLLPPGIELVVNYDESRYIKQAISEVWKTLGFAFILVVLVIFVFLHNFRATLIPAIAIPISIISTFAVLEMFGYSINILTMLGLVLAIGIVVDDTIVVLENIHRHMEEGKSAFRAAFDGMREISFAVIATTVALVAVFIPLAFQKTDAGRLFVELAVAIIGSVIISTFVALTIAPMMSARLLKPSEGRYGALVRAFEKIMSALIGSYQRVLRGVMYRSFATRMAICLVLFGSVILLTGWLMNHLEGEYVPEEDKGRFLAFISAPEGSTAEYTDSMLREMEGLLSKVPEVKIYGTIVAPSFSGPGRANQGIAFVHLNPDRDRTVQEIVNGPNGLRGQFFSQVEGAFASPIIPKSIGGGFQSPFQLVVQSDDLIALDEYVQSLLNQLRKEGFILNVNASFEFNKPELQLDIDRDRAAALGVSIADISRTMQILFGGLDLSRIKVGGKEYEVIAQLQRDSRLTPSDLDRLYVRNNRGELIQISGIISRKIGVAPSVIERHNRIRSATISGTPAGMPLGNAVEKVESILATNLPPSFTYDWTGESRDLKNAYNEVLWFFLMSLLIVYMVLAAQFESLIHPFTVILTVPLAGVGAMGLLWLLDTLGKMGILPQIPAMNMNLFSQIGFVLLIGLVTKNGILLVEFANQLRERGMSMQEAMIQSGSIRLRPILMTAVSTVSGILPIAIGFGAGAEGRRPMGVVILGGMVTSTFLTLFIIPVVYSVLADLFKQRAPQEELEALPVATTEA